jgi:hypothetical protein
MDFREIECEAMNHFQLTLIMSVVGFCGHR